MSANPPEPQGRALRALDLVILLLLVGGGGWLWLGRPPMAGHRAVVRVRGEVVAWWPLAGPLRRDTVQGVIGPVVLEHGEGTVWVVDAPCPNRLCVRQGRVRQVHDHLTCLPSGLVVSVEGEDAEGFDALQ